VLLREKKYFCSSLTACKLRRKNIFSHAKSLKNLRLYGQNVLRGLLFAGAACGAFPPLLFFNFFFG